MVCKTTYVGSNPTRISNNSLKFDFWLFHKVKYDFSRILCEIFCLKGKSSRDFLFFLPYMLSISFNLPMYRLGIRIVKRRGPGVLEPILSDLNEIKNIKKGHKVSRLFRHIVENVKIKKILGANLALALIATSRIPAKAFSDSDLEDNIVVENTIKLTTEKLVQFPLKKVRITQGYKAFHPGIDFDGVTGNDVYPIKPGRVEAISYSRYAYGNAIIVAHGDSVTSLYAHLSKIFVHIGDYVEKGQTIGMMGCTGWCTGTHLHFEVIINGSKVNPLSYL